jgi:hypothetical protein
MPPSDTAITEYALTKRYDTVTVHSMVTDSAILQGVPHAVQTRAQQRGTTGTEPIC